MHETVFDVPKLDCPSEERLVRMALEPLPAVRRLVFDLPARRLDVVHDGDAAEVLARLEPLGFGARIRETHPVAEGAEVSEAPSDPGEARVLKQLLAINGVMFVVEIGLGLYAESTALLADALDMLADATVYGLALYAVGRTLADQQRAARFSGAVELLLAAGALFEVARRAVTGSEPQGALMAAVALLALAANVTCMALLARHRTGAVHMRASWIFSTNDVLANLGVILAGGLVAVTGSAVPDLVIGALVALLVLGGAIRILRMARA